MQFAINNPLIESRLTDGEAVYKIGVREAKHFDNFIKKLGFPGNCSTFAIILYQRLVAMKRACSLSTNMDELKRSGNPRSKRLTCEFHPAI